MTTLWGISYSIWLLVCLVIASVYFFVIPKTALAYSTNHRDKVVLRYGHAVVWLLLAIACTVALFKFLLMAKAIALCGLLVYLAFIFTLGKTKKSMRQG